MNEEKSTSSQKDELKLKILEYINLLYKDKFKKIKEKKEFINNELYDIFSNLSISETPRADKIIEEINWAFDNLKVALDKLKEQEK